MADIGKVKAGLRACRVWGQTEDECLGAGCPYLTEATTDDDESWQRCLEKLHRDAEEAMTPGWISVDTYPDMAGQRYLLTVRNVHYGDVRVIIGHTGYGDAHWYTNDQIYMQDYRAGDNRLSDNYVVTHWMPLPVPPNEENDDEDTKP